MANASEQALILIQRLPDGTIRRVPLDAARSITAQAGVEYAAVDPADGRAPENLVARRDGEDLIIEVEGEGVLTLEGFFATAEAVFLPDAELTGDQLSGTALTADSRILTTSADGEQVVWSADAPAGYDGAAGDAGDEGSDHGGGFETSSLLWGGLGVGGIALAAGGGSGGGGDDDGNGNDGPAASTITGTVVAGPVIDGHDLTVKVFKADGTTQLGEAQVDAEGRFSLEIEGYTGVVIAKVKNAGTDPDYLDEATDTEKDLEAQLEAIAVIGEAGATVEMNLNPVTALARKLAEQEAGGQPTQEQVAEFNQAIADTFGLDSLHDIEVVPVNGEDFDATDGLSAGERYGALLAAFSGAASLGGTSQEEIIDDILDGLSWTDGEATLSDAARDQLIAGTNEVEAQTGQSLDIHAPEITSADTATAINENSGAGQLVYTASAAERGSSGDVIFSLKEVDDHAAFNIDANTGEVTLTADPDQETNPSYSFTVVATDAAGNATEKTVTLDINDLDEVAPAITSEATATIDENIGAGQVVYTAEADDSADISGGVTYSLKAEGDHAAFSIDPETGNVTLTGNPDHETRSSYGFTVVATDAAGNRTEQPVTLTVNDLDEATPTITSGATAAAIDENIGAGQVIYTVEADDSADISGGITYSLKLEGDHAAFSIDPETGKVTLTGNPDYEAQSSYSFTVVATDAAGHGDEQTISLDINDVDDTAPTVTAIPMPIPLQPNDPQLTFDYHPQVTAVGGNGAFVVTWAEATADTHSMFVQHFDAEGNANGDPIRLDGTVKASEAHPQVAAVGGNGAFVVTWRGQDAGGDDSIFVQRFNAGGSPDDVPVRLEAPDAADGNDRNSQVAATRDGGFVVTWDGEVAGDAGSVFVQRFDADGSRLHDTPVRLDPNGAATRWYSDAQVTATPDGGFVVTWDDDNTVFVQHFDAAGNADGETVELDAPDVTNGNDSKSQVTAVGSDGDFVVTWQGQDADGGDNSIFVQRFNNDGTRAHDEPIPLEPAGVTGGADSSPQVTALGDGGFVVTWYGQEAAGGLRDFSIYVQRFNADGTRAHDNPIRLEPADEIDRFDFDPQVATLGDSGAFVVTWQGELDGGDPSIYVQRFNEFGSRAHDTPIVLEPTGVTDENDYSPQVTAVGDDGAFVVTWEGNLGGPSGIFVQRFNADGTPSLPGRISNGDSVTVQSSDPGTVYLVHESVDVSVVGDITDATDDLWNETEVTAANTPTELAAAGLAEGTYHVYAADEAGNLSVPLDSVVVDSTAPTITSEATADAIVENSGAGQAVYTATADDAGATFSLAGDNADAFRIDATTGKVTLIGDPDYETRPSYDFAVIATDPVGNSSEQAVTLDINDVDDTAPTVTAVAAPVQLEPVGVTDGFDFAPQVTALGTGGDFVVTWYGPDADGDTSIFVQRFGADGGARGTPVRLEALGVTDGYDGVPQVTSVGAGGDFVVTWQGEVAEDDYSIFVQRFGAEGNPDGAPVRLEADYESGGDPQVTAVVDENTPDKDPFVVTWYGEDAAGDRSIFVQRFNDAGDPSGDPVKFDTGGSGWEPQVTALATPGDFVVTWSEGGGGSRSIFVQRFNDAGPRGDLIPLGVGGVDKAPSIAALSGGGFVVTWRGEDAEGDDTTFVQRFDDEGNADGDLIPLQPSGWDANPHITAVGGNGGFVVTWHDQVDDNSGRTFLQRFDGNGRIEGPIELGSGGLANVGESFPHPRATPVGDGGAFVVMWHGDDAGGDDSVFVQHFDGLDDPSGGPIIKLEPEGVTDSPDGPAEVTTVGSDGDFVVTWTGGDAGGDFSIFVQRFNADGTPSLPGRINSGQSVTVQSSEPGTVYLVDRELTFDSVADLTTANGDQWNEAAVTNANTPTELEAAGLVDGTYHVYAIDEAGNLSVPLDSVIIDSTAPTLDSNSSSPADEASAVALDGDLVLTFSEDVRIGNGDIVISDGVDDTRTIDVTDTDRVSISGKQVTIDPGAELDGLTDYSVEIDPGALTDEAGNPYGGIAEPTTLNFTTESDPSVVVFDLVAGVSSDHSGRSFDAGVEYTIHIRVYSDSAALHTTGDGPGTWGTWSGAGNLGSDDRIVLTGNGTPVEATQSAFVSSYSAGASGCLWLGGSGIPAKLFYGGLLKRNASSSQSLDLWNGTAESLYTTPNVAQVTAATMPAMILTSQGLA